MMEKPPGTTSFQAESLARIAEQNGVMLEVAFNRRFIPLVRKVIDFVRERTTITQIEGRFMKEGRADFDAGSLSAFPSDTIHCVDLVRWIAQSEPEIAATVIDRKNDEVDGIELAGSDEFRKYYGYYQEDEDFVRSIREKRAPLCSIADAAGSFRMVDAILEGRI